LGRAARTIINVVHWEVLVSKVGHVVWHLIFNGFSTGSDQFNFHWMGGCILDQFITKKTMNSFVMFSLVMQYLPIENLIDEAMYVYVRAYRASLYIPAFTKGKDQLSTLEIEKTRNVRNC